MQDGAYVQVRVCVEVEVYQCECVQCVLEAHSPPPCQLLQVAEDVDW